MDTTHGVQSNYGARKKALVLKDRLNQVFLALSDKLYILIVSLVLLVKMYS